MIRVLSLSVFVVALALLRDCGERITITVTPEQYKRIRVAAHSRNTTPEQWVKKLVEKEIW